MLSLQHRRLSLFILIATFLFCPPFLKQIQADENFSSKLDSIYTVNDLGETFVEHVITITNKTPTRYTKKYAFKLNSQNISDISVSVPGENPDTNIVNDQEITSVGITFEKKVVGQGKKREFTISYIDKDVAQKTKNTLSVYITKVADAHSFDDYSVTINTPKKFGLPTRTLPQTLNQSIESDQVVTRFTELQQQGITALFGSQESYDLTLRYHLENPTNSTGLTQVSIPPDTPFQKMKYIDIQPPPQSIETDNDGNWIATYRLLPQTQKTVNIIAKTQISLDPYPDYPVLEPSDKHTSPQEFWQIEDQRIQNISQQLKTPFDIYQYVVETLNYREDVSQTQRLGAVAAFETPHLAVCEEFTDTFITLARAINIPARRLTGFAYTQNEQLRPLSLVQDILHAWPEYYDYSKKQWFPIDPTWGDTTGGINYFDQFDLNHIVFAINGFSSSKPYPAGFYKYEGNDTKDVQVTLTDTFEKPHFSVSHHTQQKKLGTIPIPGKYTLTIENNTGFAWYHIPISVTSPSETAIHSSSSHIEYLLPFQTQQIDLVLENNSWINSQTIPITINIQDEIISTTLQSGPKIISVGQNATNVIIIMGVTSTIIALTVGSVLVFRQKR